MPDLFADDVATEDFALPGDDELLGRTAEPETAPEPAIEEPAAEAEPAAVEPQPEPAAEAAAEEPAEEPELLAGKYKSQAELERAYGELERHVGTLRQELGEARKDAREQPLPTAQQYDPEAVADHFAEHPTSILPTIQQAFANEDMALVYLGIAALEDVDRPLAEGLRIEIAKRAAITEMQEQVRPMQAQAETADMESKIGQLVERHPGIADFIDSEQVTELAKEHTELGQMLMAGTPEQKTRALATLFEIHRGRVSDTLQVTQQEIARNTAVEAQAARDEAFVASASTSSSGVKQSPADAEAAIWDAMDAPYSEGWNIS